MVGGVAMGNTERFAFGGSFDMTSFGEDAQGEIYIVSGIGTANGIVRRIVPVNNAAGDINADGFIDLDDADILVDALLEKSSADPALFHRSDVNGDGDVNGLDVQAWLDEI